MARFALTLAAVLLAGSAQAQPAQVLTGFDSDRDGKVSRQEYGAGTARELIKYDRDGDGRVTRAELPALARLPGVRGLVNRIWGVYDASGDGVVTRTELLAQADLRFTRLDVNGDGHLTREEFDAARRTAAR